MSVSNCLTHRVEDACIHDNSQNSGNEWNITFQMMANEWLLLQKPQLKPSSFVKYSNILNKYLLPRYGAICVQEIARSDFLTFSRSLLENHEGCRDGLAPKTVNCIISVMKSIMEYAYREHHTRTADLRHTEVKQPQTTMRILSRYEQGRLNRELVENLDLCNLGILLCLYTGIRIGEICALKWGDISFEENYMFIQRTMQRIQNLDRTAEKTSIVISSPKSDCSFRKIPIPKEVMLYLRQYRGDDSAFLLTGRSDAYVEPRCLENRFKRRTEKCGIRDVKFHALRHTFATRCVELGFDIKSLSEILGHSSVNITLNRYVHPSMELKATNMSKLSSIITI